MGRLDGKTALVTGGAQGIGFAGAKLFAEEGAKVFIADINAEKGEKAAAEIGATFTRCDVSKADDARAAVEMCGTVDVLYNNAGIFWTGHDGNITDISEADWDRVIAINLKSVYLFTKFAIPTMIASGRGGSIVNTGSSAAQIGIPGCDAYTATKGAIVQLTKSLAAEYGRYGIRTNAISPAAIMTPMMRQSNPENSTFDEERFLKLRTPLRRYGTPEEIAKVALFLASDESSYLNGAIIVADGGITINGDLSKIDSDYR
ncbi:MAG: SDR family oxidoreductase [Kiritimatiellae bacterium]|nr:SDR family oxidoreductase [Kiritimatiellia bacterium]